MAVIDKGEPVGVEPDRAAVQRRVLAVLTGTQVLGGVGVATGVAVGTLIAARLSGSDVIGGLAQTSAVVGAAALAVPMARVASRLGRRPALAMAYGSATFGALVAALAIALDVWPLMLGGLFFIGGASAAGLAARYAATDLSSPGRSARDLSVVVWATTIGSVAGPNLSGPADQIGRSLGLADLAGPYALAAVAFTLAALGIVVFLRPDPLRLAQGVNAGARKGHGGWRTVRGSRSARIAVAAMVVSHMVMIAVMSMAPVHLNHGHASLTVVGLVISLHIAGMYGLSPLAGWLADRFGRVPVLMAGMAQLAAAAALAGSSASTEVVQLTVALILLGVGWSFGLIAGSALLTESVPVERRPAAQGISDLLMNGGAALAGIAAGAVVAVFSFGALAIVSVALVLPMTVMLVLARDPREAT